MPQSIRLALILVAATGLALAACSAPRVTAFQEGSAAPAGSQVENEVAANSARPTCVTLLPVRAGPATDAATLDYAQTAILRYLKERVARVVTPVQVAAVADSNHLDLSG